jgi:hypothetical protein
MKTICASPLSNRPIGVHEHFRQCKTNKLNLFEV